MRVFTCQQCEYSSSGSDVSVNAVIIHQYILPRTTVFPQYKATSLIRVIHYFETLLSRLWLWNLTSSSERAQRHTLRLKKMLLMWWKKLWVWWFLKSSILNLTFQVNSFSLLQINYYMISDVKGQFVHSSTKLINSKHDLRPILTCRTCNLATQKSSAPAIARNLLFWWSQLAPAPATFQNWLLLLFNY